MDFHFVLFISTKKKKGTNKCARPRPFEVLTGRWYTSSQILTSLTKQGEQVNKRSYGLGSLIPHLSLAAKTSPWGYTWSRSLKWLWIMPGTCSRKGTAKWHKLSLSFPAMPIISLSQAYSYWDSLKNPRHTNTSSYKGETSCCGLTPASYPF